VFGAFGNRKASTKGMCLLSQLRAFYLLGALGFSNAFLMPCFRGLKSSLPTLKPFLCSLLPRSHFVRNFQKGYDLESHSKRCLALGMHLAQTGFSHGKFCETQPFSSWCCPVSSSHCSHPISSHLTQIVNCWHKPFQPCPCILHNYVWTLSGCQANLHVRNSEWNDLESLFSPGDASYTRIIFAYKPFLNTFWMSSHFVSSPVLSRQVIALIRFQVI
jgi:hypothetical protein